MGIIIAEMVYTRRILFNNIKEYTPSWMKTIPYRQTVQRSFVRQPSTISTFTRNNRGAYAFFRDHVQKIGWRYETFLFALSFGMTQLFFAPLLWYYQSKNAHRQLPVAQELERIGKARRQRREEREEEEEDEEEEEEDDE